MFIGERQDRTFYVYGKISELQPVWHWLTTVNYVNVQRILSDGVLQVVITGTVPYYCLDSVYDELVADIKERRDTAILSPWASFIETLNMEGL